MADFLSLDDVLDLVGTLDDSEGEDTARERFRRHLKDRVTGAGQVRDYVEECLRNSGDQYNRALQDLVNHVGRLLEFEVEFGRYRGVRGDEIGFDGHWVASDDYHLVVETKTTQEFAIRTDTLLSYINGLISQERIPSEEDALGLYVLGRPDNTIRQLENSILAENRTSQLRIISADSLISLAELMSEYDVSHSDVLALLRPSGPRIDPLAELMAQLVAEREARSRESRMNEEEPDRPEVVGEEERADEEVSYWIAPAQATDDYSAEEHIETLVEEHQVWAFSEGAKGRRHVEAGDWICFYAAGNGVVAHGEALSAPEFNPDYTVAELDPRDWTFELGKVELYLDNPVIIDLELRGELDAFEDKDPDGNWSWFVRGTHQLTEHDFHHLTGDNAG